MSFGADLATLYDDLGDVFEVGGVPYYGKFGVTDRTAFDAVTAGDYTLRYLASGVVLKQGDDVVVDGVAYQVADVPARINAQEFVAGLVRD